MLGTGEREEDYYNCILMGNYSFHPKLAIILFAYLSVSFLNIIYITFLILNYNVKINSMGLYSEVTSAISATIV